MYMFATQKIGTGYRNPSEKVLSPGRHQTLESFQATWVTALVLESFKRLAQIFEISYVAFIFLQTFSMDTVLQKDRVQMSCDT